jgi:predicted amidohydrolase YtcJ
MAARLTAYLVALIVGVTFIAGLIVGAQRGETGPVDLIVVNGNVYTADGDNTMAEAVAVQGNKILMVGTNREVQRLRRPQTVVIDARGGAVVPGFNDRAANFIAAGIALQQVDLEGAVTLPAIESTIKAWAAGHPEAEWVAGRGWSPAAFGPRGPTRDLLDALVPDRPALLLSEDGDRAWANTLALKRAQITRRTPNPVDGTIAKDPRTGEPTGVLLDEAIDLVTSTMPSPSAEERLVGLRAAIDDAHRRGITSIQDTRTAVQDLPLYDQLRRDNKLDVRVYAALPADAAMTDEELDALDELRTRYADDPVFKTGAVTLVADEDDDGQLKDIVAALDERGWQVIIQAIGDGASRIAKDAVDYASGRQPASERGRRHRIETADQPEDPVAGVQLAATERRTLLQAVDEVTREAAWMSFDEHRKGSIERDMLADIVILTHDIFAGGAAKPVDVDVAVTIFDGRVVYSRPTDSND